MISREHFLSLVHPNSLSIAEDFIYGKIDAMFVEYTPKGSYWYGGTDRSCIEIFENDPATPSKIKEFDAGAKDTIYGDDYKINAIVNR